MDDKAHWVMTFVSQWRCYSDEAKTKARLWVLGPWCPPVWMPVWECQSCPPSTSPVLPFCPLFHADLHKNRAGGCSLTSFLLLFVLFWVISLLRKKASLQDVTQSQQTSKLVLSFFKFSREKFWLEPPSEKLQKQLEEELKLSSANLKSHAWYHGCIPWEVCIKHTHDLACCPGFALWNPD